MNAITTSPGTGRDLRAVLAGLIRGRLALEIIVGVLGVVEFAVILIWGLVFRNIFDLLAGREAAGASVWSLLALFVVAAAARITSRFQFAWEAVRLQSFLTTLVHQNLFERILTRTSVHGLPKSAGEAV